MEDCDYEATIDDLVLDFEKHPDKYATADDVVISLDMDRPYIRVRNAAHKILGISKTKFDAAITRYKKRLDKQARKLDWEDRVVAVLGAFPVDERDYVSIFLDKKRLKMTFDREFHVGGETYQAASVETDLLLSAASMDLTKPRGFLLSDTNIKRAFEEWVEVAKVARKAEVWENIATLSHGRTYEGVMHAFDQVCEAYFTEPQFAKAAIMKGMWQTKRKMLCLPITSHHMIIIQGAIQFTGKTTFVRMIRAPIDEISAEADASQIVDDKNYGLRGQYLVFIDEMSKADRADVAKLKNIITGVDNTSRVMYSHHTQRVPINMTLWGTSNLPLGNIVYDTTGMRRFIEVHPKELAEIEPRWKMIEDFDWLGLWQSVDATGPDPIIPFADMLREKQEEMRAKDNVEAWLEYFDESHTSNHRLSEPTHVEYYASNLYQVFRAYEEQYHPASRGTAMTRWGLDMKGLIASGKAEGWTHFQERNKVIYRLAKSNITPFRAPRRDPTALKAGLL